MIRLRPHRRRRARDEMLAPWIAAAVILGGWALAARYVSPRIEPASASIPAPAMGGAAEAPAPTELARSIPAEAAPPPTAAAPAEPAHALLESPAPSPAAADPDTGPDVATLRARNLLIPVLGVNRTALTSSFADERSGRRVHEALDILAPRGTAVLAAEAGTIVKLFHSVRGGTTIYQFDPTGSFCYYYAHLDSYAPGLGPGDTVERGEVIGYVGTTGNAPPQTPHLHFAISRLGPERHWWEGVPIDPYLVLQ